MKNKNKIWLVSICCLGIGIVLLILGLLIGGRPGFYINKTGVHSASEAHSEALYIQEKTKVDPFSSIDIDVRYTDLEILPSDGYYIEYQLGASAQKPTLEVQDKQLQFKEGASKVTLGLNFFSFGGFDQDHYVKLYVPADQYFSSIKLYNNDGRISLGGIKAETMEITDKYGNIEISDFKGGKLKVSMDDGSFEINTLDAKIVELYNKYGSCDLGSVKVRNLTADMKDGAFTINKGDASDLNINNDYGKVKIGLVKKIKDYDFQLETDYGKIELPGYPEISSDDDMKSIKSNNGAANKVKITCTDGDIIITEAK